jgi:hypothetical protein
MYNSKTIELTGTINVEATELIEAALEELSDEQLIEILGERGVKLEQIIEHESIDDLTLIGYRQGGRDNEIIQALTAALNEAERMVILSALGYEPPEAMFTYGAKLLVPEGREATLEAIRGAFPELAAPARTWTIILDGSIRLRECVPDAELDAAMVTLVAAGIERARLSVG